MGKDDRGRIRVFFAEFEGNSDTLDASVKALTAAVQRTFQPPSTQVRVLPVVKADDTDLSPENLAAIAEDAGREVIDETNSNEEGTIDPNAPSSPARERRKQKRPSYQIVKDLNLRPAGQISLRDFVAEKRPSNDQERITVFVYYLKKLLEVPTVGSNHLFTCFKDIEKPSPLNIGQIARNTASRRGWIDTTSTNDLKITVAGENYVEHDLGKPASE